MSVPELWWNEERQEMWERTEPGLYFSLDRPYKLDQLAEYASYASVPPSGSIRLLPVAPALDHLVQPSEEQRREAITLLSSKFNSDDVGQLLAAADRVATYIASGVIA